MLNSLIACWCVGSQTQWWPRLKAIHFSWLGPELFHQLLAHWGSAGDSRLLQGPVVQSIVSLTKSLRGHLVK